MLGLFKIDLVTHQLALVDGAIHFGFGHFLLSLGVDLPDAEQVGAVLQLIKNGVFKLSAFAGNIVLGGQGAGGIADHFL